MPDPTPPAEEPLDLQFSVEDVEGGTVGFDWLMLQKLNIDDQDRSPGAKSYACFWIVSNTTSRGSGFHSVDRRVASDSGRVVEQRHDH